MMPGSKDATAKLTYPKKINGLKIVPVKDTLRKIPWAPDEGFVFSGFYTKDN